MGEEKRGINQSSLCRSAPLPAMSRLKTTSYQACMCVWNVITSCSPAGLSMSTPPPGRPSLRPSVRTASPNARRDPGRIRFFVGSVVTDWATSLWTTAREEDSHASESSAAHWSSSLKTRWMDSKVSWRRSRTDGAVCCAQRGETVDDGFWDKALPGTSRTLMDWGPPLDQKDRLSTHTHSVWTAGTDTHTNTHKQRTR